jgi:hypothetical protein
LRGFGEAGVAAAVSQSVSQSVRQSSSYDVRDAQIRLVSGGILLVRIPVKDNGAPGGGAVDLGDLGDAPVALESRELVFVEDVAFAGGAACYLYACISRVSFFA